MAALAATAAALYDLIARTKHRREISSNNSRGVPVVCHTDECVANEKRMKALEADLEGRPRKGPSDGTPASVADINNDTATKILSQFFLFLAQQEKTSPPKSGDEDFETIAKDFLAWRAAQNG
jgi:hypothetical protein